MNEVSGHVLCSSWKESLSMARKLEKQLARLLIICTSLSAIYLPREINVKEELITKKEKAEKDHSFMFSLIVKMMHANAMAL